MESWFERVYEEHRSRFLAIVVVTSLSVIVAVVLPLTMLIWHAWWKPTLLASMTGAIAIAAAVSGGVTVAWIRARRDVIKVLHAWLAGDRSHPETAWRAAIAFPTRLVVPAGLTAAVLLAVGPVPIYVSGSSVDGTVGALAVTAAMLGGLTASASFVAEALTLLMRPLRADISRELPADAAVGASQQTLRPRLLMGVLAGAFSAAMLSPGVTVQATTTTIQTALATLAAVLLALYMVGVVDVGFIRPALRPVADLTRAVRRVRDGTFGEPLPVTSADELGELAWEINRMQDGLMQRERLRAAFGSYVDPALATRLVDQDDHLFAGEEVEATVLFADVRDFTLYAESHSAQQAVTLLNQLFELVVPALRTRGGHANKYLGDGVLAVFGVPARVPDHADRAVEAAVEIQRLVEERFGDSLRIGIGINTGRVIAGTIGGGGKLEFTLIGDAVNVASRVESATKVTGDQILLTEGTRARLQRPFSDIEPAGSHVLKGKASPVTLYALNPGRALP